MTIPAGASAVLAVGGSAGALGPLVELVAGLPIDLAAAVLVTVHVGESFPSKLPLILARAGRLPIAAAQDGDALRDGHVYVAPPGRHLLVRPDGLALSEGARVNRHRPAIDVMFAGVAATMGPKAVALVLSGTLDDGAVGSALVVRAGGQVLTQDDAEFASMPSSALHAAPGARAVREPDLVAAVLAALESARGRRRPEEVSSMTQDAAHAGREHSMAQSADIGFLAQGESRLTRLTCPECMGAMAQVDLPQISYFTCHVGHRYSPQTLAAAQAESSEAKLWSAVAALEEQAAVLAYLRQTGQPVPGVDDPDVRVAAVAARARDLRAQAGSWSNGSFDPAVGR